ncbi:MAG: haloacid dehalogenase [Isosphaeraceae bacterium]|jgi:HAD superfamily hydrolase (TIGR01509 family)|nr:MAG: haloacid dehalogenase [Isosphaeraceae bacterium]
MIRAVIFDFNGVLVDDEHLHFQLFRDTLATVGVSLSQHDYETKYLGFDDRGCFTEALRDAGLIPDPDLIDRLIALKAHRYLEHADEGLTYFDGGATSIERLAARWPIAICSGALRAEIEHALRRMGVRHQISAIIAAEDTDRCKPDPEGYLLALDALRAAHGEDLEAGHCLVVEDSLAGIVSAKAAGMWVVALPNSYPEQSLRKAGADAVIPSLTELTPETIAQLFAPQVWP